MFIQIGNCEKCGNVVYVGLYGTRVEYLYSCNCSGKDDRERLFLGLLEQKGDGYIELYRRMSRVMVTM